MAISILLEIVAILDLLVQGPPTRSVQDPDYAEYMEEILAQIAARLESPLTTEDIRERLLQMLRVRRKYPNDVLKFLLLQGTETIQLELDRESNRQIEEHVKTLQRKDPIGGAQRSRRARSTVPDAAKQWKRASSVATSGSLQSSKVSVDPSRINERNAVSKLKVTTKRKRKPQRDAAILSNNPVPSAKNPCASDCSQAPVPVEAIVDLPISTSDESLSGRRPSIPETTKRSDDSTNPHASTDATSKKNLSPTDNVDSTQAVMASELAFCKKRCQKLKEECLILENQRRQVASLGQLPGDVTKVLNQNTRRIAMLERKLKDRSSLERYLSFGKTPSVVQNSQRLIGLFQDLKKSIAMVLVRNAAKEYATGSLLGISADLDSLLCSVFGIDTPCNLEEKRYGFPALTSFELIQALAGASIYNWIFGAEFQAHVMRTTPLLEEYRSLITTCSSRESLCDLDLAVHRSILESESFKKVIIPKMARVFRKRLTHTIKLFLKKRSKSKAIKKLRSSLEPVFTLAVEIRAESLLSASNFELIWPVAGSAVSGADMEMTSSKPIAGPGVVKLPLLPGLRAFPKKKTMVGYQGFAQEKSIKMPQDYVVKALVLC
ncbi:hypothetical protein AA0118_g9274 [Alternaria tenuissima]|nr:hypothetical protein AA0118_g9274 [Alternaria tenuissima]